MAGADGNAQKSAQTSGKGDYGNQTVKALTMIKRTLPVRFLSIRQSNRMGDGSVM
jgi:hypothetical protein